MVDKINKHVTIKNKRAEFDYFLIARLQAGIVLSGTEIKSIRQSKASLVDTFCYISNNEIWIKNMYIAPYFYGSFNNPSSRRDRKLQQETKNPGYTIIPVKLYIDENGRAKLEIALAKGKKVYDKRESIKERTDKREMDRTMKSFKR